MVKWLNGWVYVCKVNGCGFKSRCCHLNHKLLQYDHLTKSFECCLQNLLPFELLLILFLVLLIASLAILICLQLILVWFQVAALISDCITAYVTACMTTYATAHVWNKLASPNTWISIIPKFSWLKLIFLIGFTCPGIFFSLLFFSELRSTKF